MISTTTIGVPRTIEKLAGKAARVSAETNKVVKTYSFILRTRIQAKASGRPGPNAPTGDYRRSWTVTFRTGIGGLIEGIIGTAKPQARRLEYGFNGVDSIGRRYNQPPFPHVAPAVREVMPQFREAMAAVAIAS